jgi:DNA repair photolyase
MSTFKQQDLRSGSDQTARRGSDRGQPENAPENAPVSGLNTGLNAGLRAVGRGVADNSSGRFETRSRVPVDDGWDIAEDDRILRTELRFETPRSVISYNKSPDIPFDRSVNPYRGCEHGCVYCFARPGHCYLGMSAGLDFETRLIARPEAPRVLARELRAKRYQVAPVAIGTYTDPYQPVEREQRIMRAILQVLSDFNHPVQITTKGTLVERDIDILAPMASRGLVTVGVSLTTMDARLSRQLEPRAPAPRRRLEMIRRLASAGIPTRAMIAPVIPALTDHEIETLLEQAAQAGATHALFILLRLPHEVAPLFQSWLQNHHPDAASRVMGRLSDMRGGKAYDADFAQRMTGTGPFAQLIAARFSLACKRLGLTQGRETLRSDLFACPPEPGDQLSLF